MRLEAIDVPKHLVQHCRGSLWGSKALQGFKVFACPWPELFDYCRSN